MLSGYNLNDRADVGRDCSQFRLPVLHMGQTLAGVDVKLEKAILECVVRLPAGTIYRQPGLHTRALQVTWEREHGLFCGSLGFAVKILNRCDAGVPIRSPLSEPLLLLLQVILDVAHPTFNDVSDSASARRC